MTSRGFPVLGWDIGGVNIKAVRVRPRAGQDPELESVSAAFEIQRDPGRLRDTLGALARRLGTARAGLTPSR